MSKHDIYGPDPDIADGQAREIANLGLRIMKGHKATDQQDSSTGPDTSKNGLEQLKGD